MGASKIDIRERLLGFVRPKCTGVGRGGVWVEYVAN